MSQSVLIRNARAIVTCDQEDRVYYNADLLIQGSIGEIFGGIHI